MVLIKTGADDTNFGEMVCHWDDDAALMFVRRNAEPMLRGLIEILKPYTLSELPTEAEIQKELDDLSVKADKLFEEYAAEVLYMAQGRLVFDVLLKVLQDMPQEIQLRSAPDAQEQIATSMAEYLDIQPFRDLRKFMSEFLKTRHNELIGIRRGRQAGKKDAKPRARRARKASTKNRERILEAMREVGREPLYIKDVAQRLGKSARTVSAWADKIEEETGEKWGDLVRKALSPEVEK
jgi:hypothetical protein